MRQYIIFASDEEYLRVGYSDCFELENVHYQEQYLYHPTPIRKKLNLVYYHSATNGRKGLPFKGIWYKQYYPIPYEAENDYVFIFFYRWFPIFNNGYIEYLRKQYPGCKCVLFLQDINNARKLDIEFEKMLFDHIMVFERNFAQENCIEYYPLVYGANYKKQNEERPIDLLFVGGAKGRYKLLKAIYHRLNGRGINCQFYLSNMDEAPDPSETGIHIVTRVPYEENIKLLLQSKCVLDIVPPKTNCNTLRVSEAIAYDVRVLTNNLHIVGEEYYRPDLISTYTSPEDINVDFLKRSYSNVDYKYKEKIGAKAFLKHLDQVL